MYATTKLIVKRSIAVVIFSVLFFSAISARAISLDRSSYTTADPILLLESGGPYVIYNTDSGASLGGQGSYDAGDNISFGVPGHFSVIETSVDGICEGPPVLTYEECKAVPEFVGEFTFTVVATNGASVGGVEQPSNGGGGGGGPTSYRPEISITSPSRNQEFSNRVSITYSVTDQNDVEGQFSLGLDKLPVSLYYSATSDSRRKILIQKDLPAAGTYVWDAKDLPEGETYHIVVDAIDKINESAEVVSEEFSLDHSVPLFTVSANPPITTGESVQIAVESTKQLVMPPKVHVTQNGFTNTDVVMTGTSTQFIGVYSVVRGYDGPAEIFVEGTDLSGNISKTIVSGGQFSVGVRPPPKPIILSPTDQESASSTTISVRGTARADTEVRLLLNGVPSQKTKPNAAGEFVFDTVKLSSDVSNGRNFITVTSVDLAGNISEPATIAAKFNVAPEVTLISPISGETVATTTPIAVVARDKNKDTLLFTYEVSADSGAHWTVLKERVRESKLLWNTEEVVDGVYSIRVTVDDGATKSSAESTKITVRNLSPHISFDTGPKSVTNQKTYTVKGTAISGDVGESAALAVLEYSKNGGKDWVALPSSGGRSAVFSVGVTLSEGINTIAVRARDRRGVYGMATKTVIQDFGPPDSPQVISPAAGSVITTAMDQDKNTAGVQITVRGVAEPESVVDVTSGGIPVRVTADASGRFTAAGVTVKIHGENALGVTARDAADNVSPSRAVRYI